jgi:hypothetical protein
MYFFILLGAERLKRGAFWKDFARMSRLFGTPDGKRGADAPRQSNPLPPRLWRGKLRPREIENQKSKFEKNAVAVREGLSKAALWLWKVIPQSRDFNPGA